jgi:eukaryotic-like serine/threonine-protein kinase
MATVYLAQDIKHHRLVGIKVLKPELAAALGPDRFLREIETAARLTHPHILPLHDSGEVDGFLYYVMPYVDGESLRDRINRDGQLPIDDAVQITRDVASALTYAHSHDVVHRDIKPENILLASGQAVVSDFGIARAITAAGGDKLTETGMAVGTPAYMSPEQATGEPQLDGRSDIYSLGCVLYEMLAGHVPFLGASAQELLARHTLDPVPPLHTVRATVPGAVEAAIVKSLAKQPADRFSAASQFAEAFSAAAAPSSSARWASRRAVVALGAVLVIAGGLLVARSRERAALDSSATSTSLAVLDFRNLSHDTSYAYLSDGLSEEIATGLGRVPRLRVKSPSGIRRVQRATPDDLRAIGQALGVRYLVEGTVLPSRERVGVTVRLVRAGDGVLAWSEAYNRPANDVLAIVEDVSRRVATSVAGALLPAEQSALVTRPTGSTAAYDHFLKGNFYLARRTARDVARGIHEYEAAVQLDPRFVRARARIAFGYGVFLTWNWEHPGAGQDTLLAHGFAAADQALREDSTSSDAWMARGILLSLRNKRTLEGVRPALDRAISLDPRNAEAQDEYADILAELSEDSAARAAYRRALALESDRANTLHKLARSYVFGHRYEEARRLLDSAVAMDSDYAPSYALRARVRLQLGDVVGARADAETALRFSRAPWSSATMALVDIHAGDTLAARSRVEPLVHQLLTSNQATEFDAWLGIPLIALGERERALDLLELAPRGPALMWILRLPEFDPLRSTPRFERVVEESRPPTAPK